MAYFIYPETPGQLGISTEILADNGVRFRVGQEYEHNPDQPFVAKIKNYALEIFCDWEKFCFIKYLIFKRIEDIVHLEKSFKEEYKLTEATKTVDIPIFMKEEVK